MDTDKMHTLRQQEIELGYPTLSRTDFPQGDDGDKAYRQALEKQYQELRQKQYEYTLQNEAMKMYNLSRDAKANGLSENVCMWTGYSNYINAARNPEEKRRRQAQVDNCAAARSRDLALDDWGVENAQRRNYNFGTRASCAITATSVLCATSAQMGYDGKKGDANANLIIPQQSNRGHVNSAASMYYDSDSIRVQQQQNPNLTQTAIRDVYHMPQNAKTLDQMFQQKPCPFGVGDGISIVTGTPDEEKGTTGCHAMTIVDIQKDNSGKVVSYTLQANNPAAYETCYVGRGSKWGSYPFRGVVHTQDWMTQKIQDEASSKSLADLEKGIAETKANLLGGTVEKNNQCVQVNGVINDLAESEAYYNGKGYYKNPNRNQTSSHYAETYDRKLTNLQGEVDELKVAELERHNAEREQKLRQDEAALAQKEADYAQKEQDFLTEHPDYKDKLHVNEDGTPAEPRVKPDPVEIPPETQSQDLAERARVANARKEALDKKENELVDREHNLNMDSSDLALRQAEIAMDPQEQERIRKREEEQRKAEEKARKEAEKEARRAEKAARKAQRDGEPAVQPVDGQQQQQGGQQNNGEPVVRPVEENRAITHIEGHGEFRGARTSSKIDENKAVQDAQQQNQQIAAQTQQQEPTVRTAPQAQQPVQPTRSIDLNTLTQMMQRQKQNQ